MAMNKIGLDVSVLQNITPPNISISTSPSVIVENIKANANQITANYYGLGVMVTLFFFLVWKIGRGLDVVNEQYGSLRSIGISAGVVAIMGLQMLNLGYFTEYYHFIIFAGITILVWIIIFVSGNR